MKVSLIPEHLKKIIMNLNKVKTQIALNYLRSLSNKNNIKIINLLEKEKELDVVRISKELQVVKSVALHLLIEMRDRGIVVSRREDRNVLYSIKPTFHQDLLRTIDEIFTTDNYRPE